MLIETTLDLSRSTDYFRALPASSIRTGVVDRVLALDEIAPALVELVMVTA
jgi:hypothetical protein